MPTLKDLLDIAIQGEVNSQKLYQRGAAVAADTDTKTFFERLVKEEIKHENILYNIRETGLYDLNATIDKPSLFEATKDAHGNDEIAFDESWTTEKILDVALKREYNAMLRYQVAAEITTNEELKTLFENLSAEEAGHHRTIEHQHDLLKGLAGKEL